MSDNKSDTKSNKNEDNGWGYMNDYDKKEQEEHQEKLFLLLFLLFFVNHQNWRRAYSND